MSGPARPSAFRRALVVANPHSGPGRGRVTAAEAVALVRPLGDHVEPGPTRGPGHATELARAWAAAGGDLVVAVGGDGTVHEVAAGLVGTPCALAVLPSGSGNDFAAGIGCPTPAATVAAIAAGHDRPVDVAALNDMVFVNSCGLLASGLVSGAAAGYWRWLGRYRYTLAAAKTLLGYRGQPVTWRVGGAAPVTVDGPCLLAEICNGPFTGGGFRFAPDAAWDDGLLDAALIAPLPPLAAMRLLPKAAGGGRLDHPALQVVRGPEITLVADRPVAYHLDGEPDVLPAGTHRVRVLPEKLLVRRMPAP
ncbi:hypothetical protein KDM41_14820 [bacterium]|nr:hypothetical protein [bacterium]